MKKYIIEYENTHWCGGDSTVVVNAKNAEDALEEAAFFMEEHQRELFSQEYGESVCEDEEYADDSAVSITSVEELTPENDHWEYYNDPTQKQFYPEISRSYNG